MIGVSHFKWDEWLLAVVVLKPGQVATAAKLREYLAPEFAGFWLPDGFVFVDEIPRTPTGKMPKAALREKFGDWRGQ